MWAKGSLEMTYFKKIEIFENWCTSPWKRCEVHV
jgi:hypothetical protein